MDSGHRGPVVLYSCLGGREAETPSPRSETGPREKPNGASPRSPEGKKMKHPGQHHASQELVRNAKKLATERKATVFDRWHDRKWPANVRSATARKTTPVPGRLGTLLPPRENVARTGRENRGLSLRGLAQMREAQID
ncbi:hypothetical protein ZHAS_00009865 [Anopheles sinensis]|uniref:Uncharacterized protein n=1 Tax=Anopheles sinensis TaxID=74873 RepID=A0A084VW50_ANOSI|nr:hypothetical protein ZHAS_00009865 [Anopheles sinensis]